MIPQEFDYAAPASLDEALSLLDGGNAKVLAGGMSLIPLMKLRLAAPGRLVDLRKVPGLNLIREESGAIHIGAMATHYEIEASPLLRASCPLLPEVASHIGDVQVRNMGTLGGSIAHADPAADYPAALLALEARVRIVSRAGERTMEIREFLVDTMTTALEPGEIVAGVVVPMEDAHCGVAYEKMVQPASGFAIVGAAARIRTEAGRVVRARVGITGLAACAFRATGVERLLESGADARKAAAAVAEGVEPNSDLYASAAYRSQMARVYTARALERAIARSA